MTGLATDHVETVVKTFFSTQRKHFVRQEENSAKAEIKLLDAFCSHAGKQTKDAHHLAFFGDIIMKVLSSLYGTLFIYITVCTMYSG